MGAPDRCPVHGIPDCSPLLNGCSRLTAAATLAIVPDAVGPLTFDRNVVEGIVGLCHWRQDRGGVQATLSHVAFHYGGSCPYEVVDAYLVGDPDPREEVAEWRVDISLALKKTGGVPLSLNDRPGHWAVVSTAKDRVKRITREAVLAAGIPHLSHVHVEMHFRPKTNAIRDADNTVATMKPAIDALHHGDEHFFPIVDGDDARFLSWSPPVLHRAEKGRPPALWLILRSAG